MRACVSACMHACVHRKYVTRFMHNEEQELVCHIITDANKDFTFGLEILMRTSRDAISNSSL